MPLKSSPPRGAVLVASFIMLVSPAFAAASQDTGMQILQNMGKAADKLDYTGEFVYVKDGNISSMRVVHIPATENSGSQQKLSALDGSMREIIQSGDQISCILPDQNMGVREKRRNKPLFKLDISDKAEDIAQHYSINVLAPARVANRDCQRIDVIPKDAYRFGYKLCIDSEKQLLLSSVLTSLDGQVLESYKFISVSFDKAAASALDPETSLKSLNWMDDGPQTTVKTDQQKKWRISPNDAGFELEHYIKRISPQLQTEIIHLVLSDGLARVSVFISPSAASAYTPNTSYSIGSINSFTREIDGYMVTAIGEIPLATATLIAEHTEPF